jgi:membrane associated rhomboid family serine protease
MFIPLHTDQRLKRRPIVTESLIIINMLVYLVGLAGRSFGWFENEEFIEAGRFSGQDFRSWQLFSYQFLHDPAGVLHLGFNMLFLWVFGCAVEDRLSRAGFLAFYLFAGAVAAMVHWRISGGPIIGASGSIAGLTGAFLALFPRSRVRVLMFFLVIIRVFDIPAFWFIALSLFIDVLRATAHVLGASAGNIAYAAHIAGYLYGFLFALLLLALKIVPRGEFDVVRLFQLAHRRRVLRSVTRRHGTQFDTSLNPHAAASGRAAAETPATAAQQAMANERAAILALFRDAQLDQAASAYAKLLDKLPESIFPEDRQLDLANQLYASKDYRHASAAYELLLRHFPRNPKADEVKLILGLIYTRHLPAQDRARHLLAEARSRLRIEGLIALADQLQSELETSSSA